MVGQENVYFIVFEECQQSLNPPQVEMQGFKLPTLRAATGLQILRDSGRCAACMANKLKLQAQEAITNLSRLG